jgi:hypothetical protein
VLGVMQEAGRHRWDELRGGFGLRAKKVGQQI